MQWAGRARAGRAARAAAVSPSNHAGEHAPLRDCNINRCTIAAIAVCAAPFHVNVRRAGWGRRWHVRPPPLQKKTTALAATKPASLSPVHSPCGGCVVPATFAQVSQQVVRSSGCCLHWATTSAQPEMVRPLRLAAAMTAASLSTQESAAAAEINRHAAPRTATS